MQQAFEFRAPLQVGAFDCADIESGFADFEPADNLGHPGSQLFQIVGADVNLRTAGGHLVGRYVHSCNLFGDATGNGRTLGHIGIDLLNTLGGLADVFGNLPGGSGLFLHGGGDGGNDVIDLANDLGNLFDLAYCING